MANLIVNGQFEVNNAGWESNTAFGAYVASSQQVRSVARAHSGTGSLRCTWPVLTAGQASWTDAPTSGHVVGQTYRAGFWVYIPTGSPDCRVEVAFTACVSAWSTSVRDAWQYIYGDYTATQDTHYVGYAIAGPQPNTGLQMYVDDVVVDVIPPNVGTLNASLKQTQFLELVNRTTWGNGALPKMRGDTIGHNKPPTRILTPEGWKSMARIHWPQA